MSDEPREGDSDRERGEAGGDDALERVTWAGRQGWSGLPDDLDEESGEEESTGITGEFDELEAEFAEDLDTELAGEPETPASDEAPEPDDEFAFDEDDGDEASEGAPDGGGAEGGGEKPPQEPPPADDTIEADTLALADSEEAREAALAGLRARTAEHAAKRGVTDPGTAPETPGEDDGEGASKLAAEPATAIGAASAPVAVTADSGTRADQQEPPKAGLWARFMAASFLIIVSMATATAVSLLVYLTDIAKGLGGLEGLSSQLDAIDADAQNFLILGSDVRPTDGDDRGRSDTTMLLRVDPDTGVISQLSIPRDLKVNIPGHGIDRFNAAYSYGGPKLTLEVVKQLTGRRIPVNHVVNVDFNGFADAVNAIDCVYVDVDRHYFHSNVGLAEIDQYAEIGIQAGYQSLCGLKALQYVRYRHEDNDLVRAARQQGFLREARQKVPPSKLLDDRDQLIDIFERYTTSDINDTGTLIGLFKLMLAARNAQINQVAFPTESLDAEGYVTASEEGVRSAVTEFLGGGPPPAESSGGSGEGSGAKPHGGQGEASKPHRKPEPRPKPPPAPAPAVDLIDSSASAQQFTAAIRDQGGKELKFPVLYPNRLAPQSAIADDTRYFRVDGPGNSIYHGYKFVISTPGTTYPTAYYGVSGMDWPGAPLFKNPSGEQEVNGRTYELYSDAGRLRMVAFERSGEMYWVTNTLDKLLTNEEMMGIARSLAVAD